MKRAYYRVLKGLLAIIILSLLSCSGQKDLQLRVLNSLEENREDATFLLTRKEISGWTELPDGKIPMLRDGNGDPLPCQVDDVDGDGKWDELFALLNMEAEQEVKLNLEFTEPGEFPDFTVRTNIRLGAADQPGYPELSEAERLAGVDYSNYGGRTGAVFQMEGPAWENDHVGFRNYMDLRNGMDIFGKLTPAMVLDSVGIKGSPSYHQPAEWGLDVLKVGTSLGAGSIAYRYADSLYRVGDNGRGNFEVIFEGPLRSRFNLGFSNWKIGNITLEVLHQVEITAGRRFYQSNVSYSGTDAPMSLVPGIVNMKSDTLHVFEAGKNHTALVTFDTQSEDGSLLGMALLVPNAVLEGHGSSPETGAGITQTYYSLLEATEGDPVTYRFYSLWEKEDERWSSLDEIRSFLESEAHRWTQGLIVEVIL